MTATSSTVVNTNSQHTPPGSRVRYPTFSSNSSLLFRLIHLHPALTMAMAFLARRCEARMCLALAVHVKGFGFWLRCGEQTLKFGAPLALEHDLRLLLPHPASESYSRRWIQ